MFPGYVTGHTDDGLVIDDLGTVVDGWLDTGDLARLDEDGFVYLTGRAKDIIIRGGHNIDPSTVEEALLGHPDVTAAAVVGRPDTHAGEVPAAFVTVVPGATVGVEELASWAAAHVTERAAAPRFVTIVDAIPVTAVGKPYKLALRAEAARAALATALDEIPGVEDVTAQVRNGDIHVEISLTTGTDRELVGKALSSYTVAWSLAEESSDRSE
ncbi:AMP-binding enzyme [Rhodococcus sp. 2H158]